MTSRAPDLETILERLEKIEDENRFLKRMGLLILLVSGASLTVGPWVGENAGLINFRGGNSELWNPGPQSGQPRASAPNQPKNAIGSRATFWQPAESTAVRTPPVRVQSPGQGSALLAEVGSLLH